MPFVGDRAWRLMDYVATWRDGDRVVAANVRWAAGDDEIDGLFAAELDGARHPIDDETDLFDLAPPGATTAFSRGGVTVQIWRVATRVHARASAVIAGELRTGPDAPGIEEALVALGELDEARSAPPRCFYCTHSDYEPSTGFGDGHLACFVESALDYHQIATSDSSLDRKYGPRSTERDLRFRWVDELATCPRWARRPRGHGYRG